MWVLSFSFTWITSTRTLLESAATLLNADFRSGTRVVVTEPLVITKRFEMDILPRSATRRWSDSEHTGSRITGDPASTLSKILVPWRHGTFESATCELELTCKHS